MLVTKFAALAALWFLGTAESTETTENSCMLQQKGREQGVAQAEEQGTAQAPPDAPQGFELKCTNCFCEDVTTAEKEPVDAETCAKHCGAVPFIYPLTYGNRCLCCGNSAKLIENPELPYVTDYLLELTRVCSQGSKERNYHIFFQLIEARNYAELKGLGIMEPKDYAYLRGCLPKAPGIDDAQFFEELKEAFQGLGIDSKAQLEVFSTVAAILMMGNVEFTEAGEAAELKDEAAVVKASDLLGVEVQALKPALLKRLIKVGKDVTQANRTAAQAKAAADAVARLLYGRLFKWLIKRINSCLSEGKKATGQFFGVLDIAPSSEDPAPPLLLRNLRDA
ncbi:mhcA [Symbiodinium natans]|uniref:MhcA protein n=1 Tax=Symbiodinium natans TaxID=878477 RepID=A0A812MAK1_9DINO|nr:mhcA [Symbiodinium natans]